MRDQRIDLPAGELGSVAGGVKLKTICRLREVAEARGITRYTEVAHRAFLSPGWVKQLWDNTNERFGGEVIAKLCQVLDCTPGDLLAVVPIEETTSDEQNGHHKEFAHAS